MGGESDELPLAKKALRTVRPDLLLLDLNVKGNNSLHFLQTLRKGNGQPLVYVLNYDDTELVERAKLAGADAYVLKEEGQERLAEVLAGISAESFIGPAHITESRSFESYEHFDRIAKLSPREVECIPYIASTLTTEAASAELDISVFTLRNHRKNIYRKLGIQTKTELYAICQQQRWKIPELRKEKGASPLRRALADWRKPRMRVVRKSVAGQQATGPVPGVPGGQPLGLCPPSGVGHRFPVDSPQFWPASISSQVWANDLRNSTRSATVTTPSPSGPARRLTLQRIANAIAVFIRQALAIASVLAGAK